MYPDSASPFIVVVLVFGVNAVGKSSFSRHLAGLLARCALIEVDELRYKVIGGLVAHSAGMHPDHAPAEYALQCEMAGRNALLLASSFADYGFSCVIDGLEEKYARRKSWIASQIPSARVITVGLFCDCHTLQYRRAQRGWLPNLPDGIEHKLTWYRANQGGFDFVVDTGGDDIDSLARILQLDALPSADCAGAEPTTHPASGLVDLPVNTRWFREEANALSRIFIFIENNKSSETRLVTFALSNNWR